MSPPYHEFMHSMPVVLTDKEKVHEELKLKRKLGKQRGAALKASNHFNKYC